ncbi:hypothetical protein B0T26DRAFT_325440 [Lasiosphaeria miniovina]|uniref:Uncharacterized protein n=1 Tax=Lasiosphaeria miniovina TaxID=1954250 RepID=A0AA40DVW9_9PEZI|nr:uncharacterized protein B0T26DRAFT_325440 [Lasiosphaeria miniovina]KAK0718309.1 hypothetical protein B0T26DRAFT_325440 [Lasiosphaeria miniovina]
MLVNTFYLVNGQVYRSILVSLQSRASKHCVEPLVCPCCFCTKDDRHDFFFADVLGKVVLLEDTLGVGHET